jgi:hypothetical protein
MGEMSESSSGAASAPGGLAAAGDARAGPSPAAQNAKGSAGLVSAVQLARQNFPAGLGLAGLPPPAQPAARPVAADLFSQRLAVGIVSGVADRISFPAGGLALLVERVRFRTGAEAVHKIARLETEIDSEVLSSLVGRAVGALVPAVCQTGPREMYMELMPGRPAVDLLRSRYQERPYVETWHGLLLGVMDAVTDNYDRNAGNWLIGDDGTIAGIDHTAALTESGRPGAVAGTIEPGEGAIRSAFARRWLARRNDLGDPEWKGNILHPADVDQWLPAILALRPQFEQRGYLDWWQAITGRLRAIRSHAKGSQPWLATPTYLNSPSPAPTARSSRPSPSRRTAR